VLRELDSVRVVRLREPPTQHLAVSTVQRLPRLGDRGTVVQILRPGDPATTYLVEAVNGEGETIWLGEFARDELELLSGSEATE
jgi:hypothetical protein